MTPLSTAGPSDEDKRLNEELLQTLHSCGLYETEERLAQRGRVLKRLHHVLQEYALHEYETTSKRPQPQLQLRTFGSYRLGVQSREADIDTLCIAPRHCTQASFFDKAPILLETSPNVTGLRVISDAFVPVIKMKVDGIPVDLLFVSLDLDSIPNDLDILDDRYLKGLDEASVRSCNGVRVTERILQLVPNPDTFRTTLIAVKHWARALLLCDQCTFQQMRGIYSNVLGFLGGVNWAILVARICQFYPNLLPASLLARFFRIYQMWTWPNPIMVDRVDNPLNLGFSVMQFFLFLRIPTRRFKVSPHASPMCPQYGWNPKINVRDRLHLMPIITPAYPAINSSYNVMASTLHILKSEFGKGFDRTLEIETKRVQKTSWAKLFVPPKFFQRSKHFLRVQIMANSAEDFDGWFGWVVSRLRQLFLRLEALPNLRIYPFGRFFDFIETKDTCPKSSSTCEVHTSWLFIGLGFTAPEIVPVTGATHSINLTSVIRDFAFYTDQWEARHGGMDMQIDHVTRAEIPEWVFESVECGESDSKHLRKRSLNTKPSKKKKRDSGDASDYTYVMNGTNKTVAGISPTESSSKKSKGT
ncbi:hypothetical protein DD238_004988 [Peronospora effusa]|uniref:Poly(A) polymerase n=1 Tax=Peronospora effusa TaxID=542832 RepID=A0A3M6VI34_9STRA|nr:hypothetical protein DD238_004988 [Peronospora effusa]